MIGLFFVISIFPLCLYCETCDEVQGNLDSVLTAQEKFVQELSSHEIENALKW